MENTTGDGEDLANNEANIRRIDNTPLEELGEGGPAIIFDVPEDLTYGEMEIESALWTGPQLMVWYSPPDFDVDYLSFSTEVDDGEIVVTGYSPGVMSAEEVYETHPDAQHAETLRPIYDWLQEEGVRFEDLE